MKKAQDSIPHLLSVYGVPLSIGVFVVAGAATLFRPGFTVPPSPQASLEKTASVVDRDRAKPTSDDPVPTAESTLSGRSVDASSLSLPVSERDRLFLRGQALMEAGDIAAARLLLQRAADAGHAGATFALASTYDPNVLAGTHVVGLVGEPAQAKALYAKALSAGVEAARPRIAALGG